MGIEKILINVGATEPFPLHPVAVAFRKWSKSEERYAKESLSDIGQMEPIEIYEGQVIDGANRQKAIWDAGLGNQIRWRDVTNELIRNNITVEQYALAKNISRRHLTISERAIAAAKLVAKELPPVKDFDQVPLKQPTRTRRRDTRKRDRVKKEDVAAKVAELADVSLSTAREAIQVVASGNQELIEAVESGTVGVTQAAIVVRESREISPEEKAIGLLRKAEASLAVVVRSLALANDEVPMREHEQCRMSLNATAKFMQAWQDSLRSLHANIKSNALKK